MPKNYSTKSVMEGRKLGRLDNIPHVRVAQANRDMGMAWKK